MPSFIQKPKENDFYLGPPKNKPWIESTDKFICSGKNLKNDKNKMYVSESIF